MIIDFLKIEKEYPKAFEMFKKHYVENNATHSIAVLGNFDLAIGNVKFDFKSSALYEFFDALGCYVSVGIEENGTFAAKISYLKECASIAIERGLALESFAFTNEYRGRKQAEYFAFERAFHWLEFTISKNEKVATFFIDLMKKQMKDFEQQIEEIRNFKPKTIVINKATNEK